MQAWKERYGLQKCWQEKEAPKMVEKIIAT